MTEIFQELRRGDEGRVSAPEHSNPWDTAVEWMDGVERLGSWRYQGLGVWVGGHGSWLAGDGNKVGWAGGRASGMRP